MTARWAKIVLSFCLALFAALVALDNVLDYPANFVFVRHVLTMDTTFHDPAVMGRAVTAPPLWHAAYWLIIAAEAVTGALFAMGALAMFAARSAGADKFHRAKLWTTAGAAAGFLLWFFGFMVAGGEWFQMWQSAVWNGQEGAFRFCLVILAVLIFVNQPDAELA